MYAAQHSNAACDSYLQRLKVCTATLGDSNMHTLNDSKTDRSKNPGVRNTAGTFATVSSGFGHTPKNAPCLYICHQMAGLKMQGEVSKLH